MPPLIGGMERLNWHLADELNKRCDVCVIAPRGSRETAPNGVRTCEVQLRPLPRFLLASARAAVREARRWRPQTVVAGSGLTAPAAWLAARASGSSPCVYVHGLDLSVTNPLYRLLWLPVIRHMDKVFANSNYTRNLALEAGVKASRVAVVHPGVAMPETLPNTEAMEKFLAEHRLKQGSVLLSVGRLSIRKGLREFVTDVLPRIVAVAPNTCLVIAGGAPSDALYGGAQSPDSIQAAAESAGVGDRLRFLGHISDHDKHIAYHVADVHVFPLREIRGDPEGFGMVAVEAAAYGLPTVAYASGGVIDAVADGVSGRLVPPGDESAFAAAVLEMLESPPSAESLRSFAQGFAWPTFGEKIADALGLEPAGR